MEFMTLLTYILLTYFPFLFNVNFKFKLGFLILDNAYLIILSIYVYFNWKLLIRCLSLIPSVLHYLNNFSNFFLLKILK